MHHITAQRHVVQNDALDPVSGAVVQALESKVGEYRQRLRVLEVAQVGSAD